MKRAGKHLKVCGQRVPVRRATEEKDSTLKGAYGYYDINTGVVWLNEQLPHDSENGLVTHEALHALLNLSGAYRVTAAALGIDVDTPKGRKLMDRWEEIFVRVVTPHLIETFGGPAKVHP